MPVPGSHWLSLHAVSPLIAHHNGLWRHLATVGERALVAIEGSIAQIAVLFSSAICIHLTSTGIVARNTGSTEAVIRFRTGIAVFTRHRLIEVQASFCSRTGIVGAHVAIVTVGTPRPGWHARRHRCLPTCRGSRHHRGGHWGSGYIRPRDGSCCWCKSRCHHKEGNGPWNTGFTGAHPRSYTHFHRHRDWHWR